MNFSSLGDPWNGGRLEFKTIYMSNVPIPKTSESTQAIFELFIYIITFGKISSGKIDYTHFEKFLDNLTFELYFPDHMKEREIDVLEFVERDITEVLKDREFDSLSDTEKEDVIEALHAKWSHPDNEVSNRIKLFTVRSPEILKPILES